MLTCPVLMTNVICIHGLHLDPRISILGGGGRGSLCALEKHVQHFSCVVFVFFFSYNIYFYNLKNRLEKVRFIDRDLVLTVTDFYSLIKSLPCFNLN